MRSLPATRSGVIGRPGEVIGRARVASRLLAAKRADGEAERGRDAVRRWRAALAAGPGSAAAAAAVGVPRATLCRWEKRPELRSRRPRRARMRRRTPSLVAAVEGPRADNPVRGKRKPGPIPRAQGFALSDSTAGRILAHLVRLGRAVPVPVPRRPGGAVQVDTLSLGFPGGKRVRQFTAVDRLSRWTVAMAAWRATAASAARFPDKLVAGAPFPVAAIRIDGGSGFMAGFETACEAKAIALHVLPPRSPELNGRVERPQATWRSAFHAACDPPRHIDRLNPLTDAFAHRHNTFRPHDAPGQITPKAYLESPQAAKITSAQMC